MDNGFSTMHLDGRRAIVTGGASGIGRATAIAMADLGAASLEGPDAPDVCISTICPGFTDTNIIGAEARERIGSLGLEIMPAERIADVVTRSLEERVPGAQWVVWPGVEPGTYEWNPAVVPTEGT